MSLFRSLNAFFFAPQSAKGFGLMRALWAAVTLLFFLFQWQDIALFYSQDGWLPANIAAVVLRHNYHYTLFAWITSPAAVFGVYLFFLCSLTCMLVGFFPRIATIISVLLLFSFDERNSMVLGGGDTLLRNMGFILMIAPNINAFSLFPQSPISDHRSLISDHPSPTMPIWPYRLLLWQMIILYGTSFWYKLLGSLWIHGTAVDITLHQPMFTRFPVWSMNLLTPITPAIDWISLLWEGLWILLLVPRWFTDLLPPQLPRIPLKRILMIGGLFFHVGIFVLMDAGSFSLAVLTAYCGLLQDEDFWWMQKTSRRVKRLLLPK